MLFQDTYFVNLSRPLSSITFSSIIIFELQLQVSFIMKYPATDDSVKMEAIW